MATVTHLYSTLGSTLTTVPRVCKRVGLCTLILLICMIALTGCGQKGALYLEQGNTVIVADSDITQSTSQPQDTAFAGSDDNDYDKTRYLEQKQILLDDPND